MRFVICHVRNEKYLLNWWLQHHKDKFDHGIIVDYHSTDDSMDLVKQITPKWQVIKSVNKDFNAANCDIEIMNIERSIQQQYPYAWMITLNVTEFLIGNTKRLLSAYKSPKPVRMQKLIPCDVMIDSKEQMFTEPDPNVSLVKQRTFGMPMDYSEDTFYNAYAGSRDFQSIEDNVMYDNRKMRSMHNFPLNYFDTSVWRAGRHYWGTPCEDFRILWYGYSPFTEDLIQRKLAIQTQIPEADKAVGNGGQHLLNRDMAIARYEWHRQFAVELKPIIDELENRL
jgi:hypothetical protein